MCYDVMLTSFVFLVMWFFLNRYLFLSYSNLVSFSNSLIAFDDVISTPHFKPYIVYQRCRPTLISRLMFSRSFNLYSHRARHFCPDVRHLLWHFKDAYNRGLLFSSKTSLQLEGFSNVDCVTYAYTRCFVTGWGIFLGDVLVS